MQADRSHVEMLSHIERMGLDIEATIAAGQTIKSLTEHPGWELLSELVERAVNNTRDHLEWPNQPLDQAQYAGLTGRIRGLRQLRGAVEAVQIAAERAAEQQRQIVAESQENT